MLFSVNLFEISNLCTAAEETARPAAKNSQMELTPDVLRTARLTTTKREDSRFVIGVPAALIRDLITESSPGDTATC